MRPNAIGDSQCNKPKCPVCPSGGTMCHKHNICYKYKCNVCEEDVPRIIQETVIEGKILDDLLIADEKLNVRK